VNAPFLWILVPGIWGVVLWFLRRNQVLSLSLAATMCLLLSLFAAVVPIGEMVNLGSVSFTLPSTQVILGRRFVLGQTDHVILTLIYGFAGVWFGLAAYAWPHRLFAPFGMGMLAVLVAALAVEPFLYAALMVETAVLFSIPFLSPARKIGPGLQRYLIFQTWLCLQSCSPAGYRASQVLTLPMQVCFSGRECCLGLDSRSGWRYSHSTTGCQ